MAQIIQIPVSFKFRTTKVQWMQVSARLKGWRKRQDGTEDHEFLTTEIESGKGKETINIPLSHLSEKERGQCIASLGKKGAGEAVGIGSALQIQLFVNTRETYIGDAELMKHSQPADAWQMRDDFLRLKPDHETALAFLDKWGRWRPQFKKYADLSEMINLQTAVRQALISSPDKWFASDYAFPTMVHSRSPRYPYLIMLTDACQVAIRMTTDIDLLGRLKFKTCARRDCGTPFPVTSNHKKNYCRQYCGHLESVRRNRKTTTKRAR